MRESTKSVTGCASERWEDAKAPELEVPGSAVGFAFLGDVVEVVGEIVDTIDLGSEGYVTTRPRRGHQARSQ